MNPPATVRARAARRGCSIPHAVTVLAALLVVAAATLVPGGVARAQTQSVAPTLTLAGQSAWVPLNGSFTLQLQSTGVPAGAVLALTLHDRLQSRTAFEVSTSGGTLGSTRDQVRIPFDSLPVDADGNRIATLVAPVESGGGVYPLEVGVRSSDDQSLASFVTHVVTADLRPDGSLSVGVPLSVAWVWPLRAEPAYLPNGFPNPAVVAELTPNGRLGRQVASLGAATDVPVTLAPSPETLDAWETLAPKSPALAQGVAALRTAATHDQVLTGPYVPLDYPSILSGNLGGIIGDELGRGVTTLESFFGTHIDAGAALPGPLDANSLRVLQFTNVRQLVVAGSSLVPVNEKYTPAHPTTLQAVPGDESTSVTALATDEDLERYLTGDDPPALRAAHLLAGLALVADEQPSLARGVALVNDDQWDANNTFVAAMLAGLRGNPLVKATTVSTLLATVPKATTDGNPDSAELVRQLAPYKPPAPPVTLAQYQRGQSDEAAVKNLVGLEDPRAIEGDRALASVTTAMWANPAGRTKATALLGGINGSVTGYLRQIELPRQSTITITSSSAQIPITMKNNGAQSVTVHLALQSDRLLFPDGSETDVVLPPGRNTTVRIKVETRSSGTSPATVTVTAAGLEVGSVRITVQSSFVSGVGIFLTVGAILFLAIWWGWDIRRRRRKRGPKPARSPRVSAPTGQPA